MSRSLLAAFRITKVAVPGWEADDVIGTLVAKAKEQDVETVIVSGDKDLYQLIEPGVFLLNPGRGGPAGVEETWVDETNASERLGRGSRARWWTTSLWSGDSSDNVPGVKGIGDKGARLLLAQFGDLDTLLARAGEVTQKRSPRSAGAVRRGSEALTPAGDDPDAMRRCRSISRRALRRSRTVRTAARGSLAARVPFARRQAAVAESRSHESRAGSREPEPGAASREPDARCAPAVSRLTTYVLTTPR